MVSISGFEELADELDAAADAVDDADVGRALDDAVEETGHQVVQDAQRYAPVDTGELRASIHLEKADLLYARYVVADADHAKPVEYGSAAHTVTPTNADALRFEVDGEVVFAQSADIPARAPNPFLRSALYDNQSTLARNIHRHLRQTLQGALESR